MPLTPHGALPLIKQVALTERDTLINATSFTQGAALGWVQQLGLQPATLVQPTQWNHAFIWTFVQGERRGQARFCYAEPLPKVCWKRTISLSQMSNFEFTRKLPWREIALLRTFKIIGAFLRLLLKVWQLEEYHSHVTGNGLIYLPIIMCCGINFAKIRIFSELSLLSVIYRPKCGLDLQKKKRACLTANPLQKKSLLLAFS